MAALPLGHKPFVHLTEAKALNDLRHLLHCMEIPDATLHRLHDLRRGRAEDIAVATKRMDAVQRAGQWASRTVPATHYLNDATVEAMLAPEEAIDDSTPPDEVDLEEELARLMSDDSGMSD